MRYFSYLFWMSYYFITGLPFLVVYCLIETVCRIKRSLLPKHGKWNLQLRVALWDQGCKCGIVDPVKRFWKALGRHSVMIEATHTQGQQRPRKLNPFYLVRHTRYSVRGVYRYQLQMGCAWWVSWGRGKGYVGGMTLILWHSPFCDRYGYPIRFRWKHLFVHRRWAHVNSFE